MSLTRGVITGGQVPAGSGVTLLARLRAAGGQLLTRASVSAISYAVTDLAAGTQLGTAAAADTTSISDQLVQGDVRWQEDSQAAPGKDGLWGYNFLLTLPAALFDPILPTVPEVLTGPPAPTPIQCDVAFTPATGQAFRVVWRWVMLQTYDG